MSIFDFLQDISPWWWVAFALGLGAVEMATMSFFLIWPGFAAVLVAIILWISPDLSGALQVTAFAVSAIILTFLGRMLFHRFGDTDGAADKLNSRANLMVGRHAQVAEFTGPEGRVTIDGVRWHARWSAGAAATVGETVKVVGAEGMALLVE